METYTSKKIFANYDCCCSAKMFSSKIITNIVENHSEFSGWANSCNKFVSSRSLSTMK